MTYIDKAEIENLAMKYLAYRLSAIPSPPVPFSKGRIIMSFSKYIVYVAERGFTGEHHG